MSWLDQPAAVLSAYNAAISLKLPVLWDSTGSDTPAGRKLREAAARFGAFCEAEGIDPYAYVLAAQETVRWRFRVPLEQLTAIGHLRRYRGWQGDKALALAGQERDRAESEARAPQVGGLSFAIEAIKRGYALSGEWDLCRVHRDLKGFNAESRWCQECPLRVPCRGEA